MEEAKGFTGWLYRQWQREDDVGNFAMIAMLDTGWPRQAVTLDDYEAYLRKWNAYPETISVLRRAWHEFLSRTSREDNNERES